MILQSFDSSLKSCIRYQDPDPSVVSVDDFYERQEYMLAMQSIVQNSPNYNLANNQNDENRLESHMTFGSFDLRPKMFDSFDIEWTSTGQIYDEILAEADNIIEALEYETKTQLGLTNENTFN
ncbi:MAG: hypothetical protein U5K00_00300 [Melioribacteraceae bacterium]|nr:hypothetical protein [Melioribacteraceae bacterium]